MNAPKLAVREHAWHGLEVLIENDERFKSVELSASDWVRIIEYTDQDTGVRRHFVIKVAELPNTRRGN